MRYDYEYDEEEARWSGLHDDADARLAREMLRIALETHDGDEIYAARRYLREVTRSPAYA